MKGGDTDALVSSRSPWGTMGLLERQGVMGSLGMFQGTLDDIREPRGPREGTKSPLPFHALLATTRKLMVGKEHDFGRASRVRPTMCLDFEIVWCNIGRASDV